MKKSTGKLKSLKFYQQQTKHRMKMKRYLDGFWLMDVCNYKHSPYFDQGAKVRGILDFSVIKSERLKEEFKFFFAYNIDHAIIKPITCWVQYAVAYRRVIKFINERNIVQDSILEVSKEAFLMAFRTWLIENGHSITKADKLSKDGKPVLSVSGTISFFNSIYDFYYDFYDEREEIEKDIWELAKLGIDYNEAAIKRRLDFTSYEQPWKEIVKKYIKERAVETQDIQLSTAVAAVIRLGSFFKWIAATYPEWKVLTELTREDILNYLHHLKTIPMGGTRYQKKATDYHVKQTMLYISVFLDYIQMNEWDIAPAITVNKLITTAEKPDSTKKRSEGKEFDYIPDEVWDQVTEHIHKLKPVYKIMVLALEESGFRITDICSLNTSCLHEDLQGNYWLRGDQRKVKVKNHMVPITEELAAVIQAQIEYVKDISTEDNNPKNYLFPHINGRRKGKPISVTALARNLNDMAKECNIRNHKGEIFRFKAHQFRHRYGMTLVNKGVNIVIIQELMAHTSPEMTARYAKLLDTTKRKAWEDSREAGALRLESDGQFVPVDLESIIQENGIELEWIRHNFDSLRMDHGICIKSPKLPCSFLEEMVEPPCVKNKCRSFHVDSTFASYYQSEINKMEQDIEIYKRKGRTRSIELTEHRLDRYKKILQDIKTNGGIFGIPKDKREYINEEREKVEKSG